MKSDPNPVSTNNIDFENKIEFGHYGIMKRNDTAQHFQLISESDTGTWCRKRNHLEIAVHFGSTRSSAVALTSVSMVRLRQITDRAGSLVNHPGEAWSPKKGKKKPHNVHVRVATRDSFLFFSFLYRYFLFARPIGDLSLIKARAWDIHQMGHHHSTIRLHWYSTYTT